MGKLKHLLRAFICVCLILTLAGCGNKGNTVAQPEEKSTPQVDEGNAGAAAPEEESGVTAQGEPEEETVAPDTNDGGNGTLVIYFSRTGEQYGVGVIDKGNTEIVAELIAEETGADLYKVEPKEDNYPDTYEALTDIAKKEQNENARPAYVDTVPDLSKYDTVYIGSPVWWGDWPMIMYTFFENEDLSGKTLYPFSTHAGSGLSGFDKKLSAACPDSTVGAGLAIAGTDAQNNPDSVRGAVQDWIAGK